MDVGVENSFSLCMHSKYNKSAKIFKPFSIWFSSCDSANYNYSLAISTYFYLARVKWHLLSFFSNPLPSRSFKLNFQHLRAAFIRTPTHTQSQTKLPNNDKAKRQQFPFPLFLSFSFSPTLLTYLCIACVYTFYSGCEIIWRWINQFKERFAHCSLSVFCSQPTLTF